MHLNPGALPGAMTQYLDPAAQAVAAQVFGRRAPPWTPGPLLVLDGDVTIATVGAGLRVKEGVNARMGVDTLVAGSVVVNTAAITANSRIFLSGQNSAGVHGELTVSARTAGTSFTISSGNVADTRSIGWMIVEPAP